MTRDRVLELNRLGNPLKQMVLLKFCGKEHPALFRPLGAAKKVIDGQVRCRMLI